VTVEYLVTGKDSRAKPLSPAKPLIRTFLLLLEDLNDKSKQTLLGIAKILKKQE
jgi:hypothetical protein